MSSGLQGGYTTGCCAAAAAKAAALVLSGHAAPPAVALTLPDGDQITLPVAAIQLTDDCCTASIRKDAGDDPDVTHGSLVMVSLSRCDGTGIQFRAGEGVGTVTLPGLAIPPGEPAINPGPRLMIEQAIREVTSAGLTVTVSIPGGRELAQKTFNPRLGIIDGLSILGSTGRVRPFSHDAVRESIRCSLAIATASGITEPVFVPGHIGARAAERHLCLAKHQLVEVGNEWGYMLQHAVAAPLERLLLLGHPGKLAKLRQGQWDTHSSRSESALPGVAQLCSKLFGQFPPATPTVEGLFLALDAPDRSLLAAALAGGIAEKVIQTFKPPFPVAVVLTDNNGAWLGSSGEIAPWQGKESIS
ncbi:cobalt-precorrin-5B (C(1))-methyltransferase CbiD [Trichlorobacter lovleyi]|uniref:cobalt-precorrin-5B (C(1))-methyltransferase CbiD n=1 Tax=Trichlorobacter lovleyi TaxID=313985 RepID=UPI0023F3C7D6|nr:cobalt-precorrin-5B (C(1))-methyltransferase CbiD [Trichlorobacter lovleyi]